MVRQRVSTRQGMYVPEPISSGTFTPEQIRYLTQELQKISGAVSVLDSGYSPRWDDLKFPFTQPKRGSNLKRDFDETTVGLLFPQNDTSEVVYIVTQMPHGYQVGTGIRPHIHWQQSSASFPTWTLEYKWFDNFDAVPAAFTTLTTSTGVESYVSGNLSQISEFAEIDGSAVSGTSSILLMKLYRNDNVVTGDVLGFEFDIHYRSVAPGTNREYTDL